MMGSKTSTLADGIHHRHKGCVRACDPGHGTRAAEVTSGGHSPGHSPAPCRSRLGAVQGPDSENSAPLRGPLDCFPGPETWSGFPPRIPPGGPTRLGRPDRGCRCDGKSCGSKGKRPGLGMGQGDSERSDWTTFRVLLGRGEGGLLLNPPRERPNWGLGIGGLRARESAGDSDSVRRPSGRPREECEYLRAKTQV